MKKISITMMLALCMSFCACAKKEKKETLMPPTPALLSQAQGKSIYAYISTVGTTASRESVNIMPQVSGQIVKINFKQGEHIKAGQILAEIDKRPYQASVMQAEGNLKQAVAQLKIDELEVERNRKLAKNNYVDKQTFDSYLAKVESDKGLVETYQGALESARINLQWCEIKAPIDGKVGLYNINLGNIVTANSSVITTIENVDKLYVDFTIPSQNLYDAQKLMKERGGKLGILVSYIEDDFTSKRFRKADVNIVFNKIRYETGTAVLRGELDNQDFLFWPDQPVKVTVDMTEVKSAVLIPDGAIQMNSQGEFVYVATPYKGGVYIMRQVPVKTGQLYQGNMRMVQSGVKAGEFVALRVSKLRLQAGPFVYRATEQGAIIDADGKVITDQKLIMQFLKDASVIADGLRKEFFEKMAKMKASHPNIEAEVKKATAQVSSMPAGQNSSDAKSVKK